MMIQATSAHRDTWLRWIARATWIALAVNIVAVYGMTLRRGRWPMSHPYSGLTMLFSIMLFGAMDRWLGARRASPTDGSTARLLLPVASCLAIASAIMMMLANYE